jgi:hypothetical protein
VVDDVADDRGFLLQCRQHPAAEHGRADHAAEVALEGGGGRCA